MISHVSFVRDQVLLAPWYGQIMMLYVSAMTESFNPSYYYTPRNSVTCWSNIEKCTVDSLLCGSHTP